MNLFNMGPMEMLFILVLALLIFGPRRLPELARDVGKAVRQFQQASQQLTGELTKEMEQASKEMDEAGKSITGTVTEVVGSATTELTAAGTAAATELKQAAATVNAGLQQAAAATAKKPRRKSVRTRPAPAAVAETAAEITAVEEGTTAATVPAPGAAAAEQSTQIEPGSEEGSYTI